MPIAVTIDSGSNVSLMLPQADCYRISRRPTRMNIADSSGGKSSPQFEGEVELTILTYDKTNFSNRGQTLEAYLHNQAPRPQETNEIELDGQMAVEEPNPATGLTRVHLDTRLTEINNLFSQRPNTQSFTVTGVCNERSRVTLMSTGYLHEELGFRVILDHLFPRLESMTNPQTIVPLLYNTRLYYLPALVYLRGCKNDNCHACQAIRATTPTAEHVVAEMDRHDFNDAIQVASNVINSSNYEAWKRREEEEYKERKEAEQRPQEPQILALSSQEDKNEMDIIQAAQQLERRHEMRRQGVNPSPHQMRERHHIRRRQIDHQTADDIFGHYGVTPAMLKATLNSGATVGLHYVAPKELPSKFNCAGCTSNMKYKRNNYESTYPGRVKAQNEPIRPWHCISGDLMGPMGTESLIGRNRWLMAWTCNSGSGDVLVFFYHRKSEAWKSIEPVIDYCVRHGLKGNPEELLTDTDACFVSPLGAKPCKFQQEWKRQCQTKLGRTVNHVTSLHASNNNSTAERTLNMLSSLANAFIARACYRPSMWEEAVKAARGILRVRVSPTHWHHQRRSSTPCEIATGERPNLVDLFPFGAPAYPVAIDSRTKHMRSRLMRGTYHYLRPDETGRGTHILLDVQSHTLRRYTHVWIDEKGLNDRHNALLDLSEIECKNKLSQRGTRVKNELKKVLRLPPGEEPHDVLVLDSDIVLKEVGKITDTHPSNVNTTAEMEELSDEEEHEEFYDDNAIMEHPDDRFPDDRDVLGDFEDEIDEPIEESEETEVQALDPLQQIRRVPKLSDEELRERRDQGATLTAGDVPASESRKELELRKGKIQHLEPTRKRHIRQNVRNMENLSLDSDSETDSDEHEDQTDQEEDGVHKTRTVATPIAATKRSPRELSRRITHWLPSEVIGERIDKVRPTRDGLFGEEGTVVSYDPALKKYTVEFEGGDTELLTIHEIEDNHESEVMTANWSNEASRRRRARTLVEIQNLARNPTVIPRQSPEHPNYSREQRILHYGWDPCPITDQDTATRGPSNEKPEAQEPFAFDPKGGTCTPGEGYLNPMRNGPKPITNGISDNSVGFLTSRTGNAKASTRQSLATKALRHVANILKRESTTTDECYDAKNLEQATHRPEDGTVAKIHKSRTRPNAIPDLRMATQGRDRFLDQIRHTNCQIAFELRNPYPQLNADGTESKRYQAYNRYRQASTMQEAKKSGATRAYMREDLNRGLFAVDHAMEMAMSTLADIARTASLDLTHITQIKTEHPAFATGTRLNNYDDQIQAQDPKENHARLHFERELENTQRAASLEDHVVETVDRRINSRGDQQSLLSKIFDDDLPEHAYVALVEESRPTYSGLAQDCYVPRNEKDARTCKDSDLWMQSELEEIMELIKNSTFEVVKIDDTGLKRPIRTKMVYKAKSNAEGSLSRRKSRFVGKGFLQKKYQDYFESRSSVTEYITVRALIAIATQMKAELRAYDIKNAFVSAALPECEQVYLDLPKNTDILRKLSPELDKFLTIEDYEGPVTLKAVRSIYGLVQSPRRFAQKLTKKLESMGFNRTVEDECCYVAYGNETNIKNSLAGEEKQIDTPDNIPPGKKNTKWSGNRPRYQMCLCGWVDDLLCVSQDPDDDAWFKQCLSEEFNLSEGSGENVDQFLGMRINRSDDMKYLTVTCEKAVKNLLHSVADYVPKDKLAKTPMATDAKLDERREDTTDGLLAASALTDYEPPNNETDQAGERRSDGERLISEEEYPYRRIVGTVLHMSRTCRPDISLAVSELSRHLGNTTNRHVNAANRLLCYLRRYPDIGIVYHSEQSRLTANKLEFFSDSDWAGNSVSRKSRSGNCTMLNSGCIDWFTKLQTIQTLSSCEAETVACVEALRTALALRILFIELSLPQPGASTVKVDNQALQLNANSEKYSSRSKHFSLRTETIREYTRLGRIRLDKVHTSENLADLFTKPLDEATFIRLRDQIMGLTNMEVRGKFHSLNWTKR